MKIHIRYFASVREHIGMAEETIDTSATTLDELRRQLITRGDVYASALETGKAIRMAINQSVCDGDTLLQENAEVAFFPPVTGG